MDVIMPPLSLASDCSCRTFFWRKPQRPIKVGSIPSDSHFGIAQILGGVEIGRDILLVGLGSRLACQLFVGQRQTEQHHVLAIATQPYQGWKRLYHRSGSQ
nr:hypothetical protein [Stutzerimonas stutzeri]